MNIEIRNLKDDEWITTDDKGRIHFIKTNAQTEEMKDILNKENVLKLLQYDKVRVLNDIDETKHSMKENKLLSIFAFLGITLTLGIILIVKHGFNGTMIPSFVTGFGFLGMCAGVLMSYIVGYFKDKKFMRTCEEYLQEINEKEPDLEKEIAKLKEKYNFREEVKEKNTEEVSKVNDFENLKYENREEKDLVRTRIRK